MIFDEFQENQNRSYNWILTQQEGQVKEFQMKMLSLLIQLYSGKQMILLHQKQKEMFRRIIFIWNGKDQFGHSARFCYVLYKRNKVKIVLKQHKMKKDSEKLWWPLFIDCSR